MDIKDIVQKAYNRLDFKPPYTVEEWIDKGFPIENYHKHTTWSNVYQPDSATSIPAFMKMTEERGGTLYFSGEHGYPGEWIHCYDVCKDSKLNFRYSAEVYWVKDIDQTITEEYQDKKGNTLTREVSDRKNCHMVLIARTYKGLRKLNYIISEASDRGYYYRPRIDLKLLDTLDPEDVYITSACISGWKYDDAEDIWLNIAKKFGSSFFLEYQANDTPEQIELNRRIYNMSQKYGIKTIVGLDTHYLNLEDMRQRDVLLKRKGIRYEDEEGWYMDYPDSKLLINRLYKQQALPDDEILYAMLNTLTFIDGCEEIELDTGFKIPVLPQYRNCTYEQRSLALKNLLVRKFKEEPEDKITRERQEGLLYEYGEFVESGCADYPLSNHHLIHLALTKYGDQLTTTSRGSAASYYTSKLLGFTTMDRYESEVPIYPERFMTRDRVLASHSMPDIDMNVAKQEPFVLAAKELFGDHGCYPLLACGKFGEKSGFKMYADIAGILPAQANEISVKIDEYNEAVKNAEDEAKEDIHIEDYITDRNLLKIYKESLPYQGIIEQARVHACGFLIFNGNARRTDDIGYGDIRYEIGLIRCKSESTGKSTIVVNCEGGLLDAYGYVKDDFLIVDVVSVINKLYKAIGRDVPTVTELREMVAHDKAVWDLYANGITCCLNQVEGAGTTKKAMRYKPHSVQELAAFIAGIRPGFKSLLEGFLRREPYSNGEKAIDDLLSNCFHYMLYQEAVMTIFTYLGIPMKDSYDTIKKISKKKLKGEALERVENTLKEHWMEKIGNLKNFDKVYKVVKDSARYSFNAPHALAMAFDSLYCAWMKAHYPDIFYTVTMNHYSESGKKDKVAALCEEAKKFYGYKMGRFEWGSNNSRYYCDKETKTIYPEMTGIKGFGQKAVDNLFAVSEIIGKDAGFLDIYMYKDDAHRISAANIRKLVKIGYFRKFGSSAYLTIICDIADKWGSVKTLKKEAMEGLGIVHEELDGIATDVLASGKVSATQYRILDNRALIRLLIEKTPIIEDDIVTVCQEQYGILGYTDIEIPENTIDWKTVIVDNINTTYSPVFDAYSPAAGKSQKFKIYKKKCRGVVTSFSDLPISDGDVIYIKDYAKKEKKTKNAAGKWVGSGQYEWWILDYKIVRKALKAA